MTLIACTINQKVPFLMGDLLLSSKNENSKFHSPTSNYDISNFLPTDAVYKPDSLAQKIYIIDKNVCISLAGNVSEMKDFLRDFKLRCSCYNNIGIKEEHIKAFLNEYPLSSKFVNSAFFIMLIEHRQVGSIFFGHFNFPSEMEPNNPDLTTSKWAFLKTETYGEVYACGTGKNGYLNITNEQTAFASSFEKNNVLHALQSNVILIARLLAIERVTLYTLKSNWGAGFEAIFYNGTSFQKVNNIAYVISEAEFDEDGDIGFPIPSLILYYKYYEGILVIIGIEIEKYEVETIGNSLIVTSVLGEYKSSLFVVEGIDSTGYLSKDKMPSNFSYQTHSIAHGYAIRTPKNETFNPAFYTNSRDLEVSYTHGISVEVTIRKEIVEKVRADAKTIFPNLK